jgi:hypothetical protein
MWLRELKTTKLISTLGTWGTSLCGNKKIKEFYTHITPLPHPMNYHECMFSFLIGCMQFFGVVSSFLA